MGHHHGHHHHHHHHHHVEGKNLFISILINIGITVSQVLAGLWSGSLALLTDATHNLSDVISLVVSWVAQKLSQTKQTEKRTFGLKRAEILGAFINAATLLTIGIFLSVEAFKRFYAPVPIKSYWVVAMGLLSVLGNGACVLLLQKDAKHSLNIRSSYIHLLTDMLTSIGVMVSGLLMAKFQWYWIDGLFTIAIAVYLIFSSWGILRETLQVFMQFSPASIPLQNVEKEILEIPEVEGVHHVHLWRLNDKEVYFECHLDLAPTLTMGQVSPILKAVEKKLKDKFGISHCVIQPEASNLNYCAPKDLIADE